MNNIIKDFVVGSTFLVVLPFYLTVMNLQNKNYSYEDYSLIAPAYLGMMNVVSGIVQREYNLTDRERYIMIGLISPPIVITFARYYNTYNFTDTEWLNYSVRLIAKHFLLFNVVIYYLNRLI